MIDINETFTVAAPADEVYRVLSDPSAVVECVEGATLGAQRDDGSYDGKMTVKFSALRVSFSGRVALELDEEARQGTVRATGRDGQGGTKFQATASFRVEPADRGQSLVTATGEVVLSGKLASMIENAAGAVVRRMTDDFVTALSVRCASGSAEIGAGPPSSPEAPAESQPAGVLLLHGFGGSPNGLRAWGEALAAAGVAVSIPRLPGHGTRWQDLGRTSWPQWYAAAADALAKLREEQAQVFVMGISLGAALALRLAEQRPSDVAGVVAVNPVVTQVAGTPRPLGLARLVRRSARAVTGDVHRAGVTEVGYERISLRAAGALRQLGAAVLADLDTISVPVLLGTSAQDHVVPPADGEAVWSGLPAGRRERVRFAASYHLVPVDDDDQQLFTDSINFIRNHALATRP
jgi:esterase/lipase/carbon monoxide dehydrogenase subunit G